MIGFFNMETIGTCLYALLCFSYSILTFQFVSLENPISYTDMTTLVCSIPGGLFIIAHGILPYVI